MERRVEALYAPFACGGAQTGARAQKALQIAILTIVSKTVSGFWVRRGFKSLPLRLTEKPHGYAVSRRNASSDETTGVVRFDDETPTSLTMAAAVFSSAARSRFSSPAPRAPASPRQALPGVSASSRNSSRRPRRVPPRPLPRTCDLLPWFDATLSPEGAVGPRATRAALTRRAMIHQPTRRHVRAARRDRRLLRSFPARGVRRAFERAFVALKSSRTPDDEPAAARPAH